MIYAEGLKDEGTHKDGEPKDSFEKGLACSLGLARLHHLFEAAGLMAAKTCSRDR